MNLRTTWGRCRQFLAGRLISLGQIAVVFVLGYFVHWVWPTSEPSVEGSSASAADQPGETGVQKWTCAMHPQIQKDGPGKCPLCSMDLIPLTAGKTMGMRFLIVTPEARALMNLEVAPVERRFVEAELRMVGKVEYDETRLKYITAWVAGRLDVLYVNFTGVSVKKGDHLAEIYSEELYSAQQELIVAVKSASRLPKRKPTLFTQDLDLLSDAREKLWLLGLSKKKIAEIELKKKPDVHIEITAPVGGTVVEKLRQQGDRVKKGDRIYGIVDLSQVWIKMDAYESDLKWIRYGQRVEITTEAYRGMKPMIGRVVFIDPILDKKTRTVKVRVNIDNRNGLLKPEMFVHAIVRAKVAGEGRVIDSELAGKWVSPMHPEIIKNKPGICDICKMPLVKVETQGYVLASDRDRTMPLVIPVSAALLTGTRAIVYVELPQFPREILDKYQSLTTAMAQTDFAKIRKRFSTLKSVLSKKNNLLHSDYARRLWKMLVGRLRKAAESGEHVANKDDAQQAFDATKISFDRLQENFTTPDKPTFAGRQIVLGPRAGDFYLVRHGLEQGEIVVSHGNFKIDSALQIEAKPSMMTPEGGGGPGAKLPLTMRRKVYDMLKLAKSIKQLMQKRDLKAVRQKYAQIGKALAEIDADSLEGYDRKIWLELKMLLENDLNEGGRGERILTAEKVLGKLQATLSRMDRQFGVSSGNLGPKRYDVPSRFQQQLAGAWQAYLGLGDALARDNAKLAASKTGELTAMLAKVDMKLLSDSSTHVAWMRELGSMRKILKSLSLTKEIEGQRKQFSLLSPVMQVVAISFGFGEQYPVYQFRCNMAFNKKGANWLQGNDKTRNPYFGSAMLGCQQQRQLIAGKKPEQSPNKKKHEHPE